MPEEHALPAQETPSIPSHLRVGLRRVLQVLERRVTRGNQRRRSARHDVDPSSLMLESLMESPLQAQATAAGAVEAPLAPTGTSDLSRTAEETATPIDPQPRTTSTYVPSYYSAYRCIVSSA